MTMTNTKNPKDTGQQDRVERRQCKRLPLSYPIEVSGFDHSGKLFRDQVVTLDVSDQGCKFELPRELRRGDFVRIRLAGQNADRHDNGKPLLFEVVWVEPGKRCWTVGAAKLQPENIWHISFPSNHQSPKPSR